MVNFTSPLENEQDKDPGKTLSQANRVLISFSNTAQTVLAEAYINGFELPDSVVMSTFKTILPIIYKHFSYLLIFDDCLLEESDQLAEASQELMKIQYNLPTELFKLMLGENDLLYPKYTMALWEKGAANLEEAQKEMIDDFIIKADLQDGQNILDLGCGWGSAANYILAKFPNTKVTSLNLSHQQCNYMRDKMQDPKSYLASDRFTLCEQDFNEANFEKQFDRIIAIGLFEHIGNLTLSFEKLASFLKDEGKVFLHIISFNFSHNCGASFINRYIFPGVRIWYYQAIPQHNQSLKTIQDWYMNGLNYAKTLQVWLDNFDAHQEQIKKLDFGMDYAKFRRIWRLYLLWCIAYFEACDGEVLGNGQYLMVKAGF